MNSDHTVLIACALLFAKTTSAYNKDPADLPAGEQPCLKRKSIRSFKYDIYIAPLRIIAVCRNAKQMLAYT